MYGDIKYGADRNPDPETLLSGRGDIPPQGQAGDRAACSRSGKTQKCVPAAETARKGTYVFPIPNEKERLYDPTAR